MYKMMKILNMMILLINNSIINLFAPKNISLFWNGGSFLFMLMMCQIISGIFLSFIYSNEIPFISIEIIMRNIDYGFMLRWIHMNGASFVFAILYMHMFRSLYYNFYHNSNTWISGVILFIVLMMIAFFGYVLPFGQMSYWAAVVITKFVKSIPYIGNYLVTYLWSGFGVSLLTLKFFYSLHYILPLILLILIGIHGMGLHLLGSSSPLYSLSSVTLIKFYPKYVIKDLININFYLLIMMMMSHNMFFEAVNYSPADYVITPNHIKPEWYFLFAYAILRSVPNKLVGIMLMATAVMIFMKFSMYMHFILFSNFKIYNKMLFSIFLMNFFVLSWVGGNPISDYFIMCGSIMMLIYFMYFFM